jgi:DNA-directed RNA polymerase subunit alpha
MAILNFQKPDKVLMQEADGKTGVFEFRPLEPGYGITIGNALRRVLLSSLEGYAITSIKVPGVSHEFSTLEGVIEDVSEIILNLKQVRLKHRSGSGEFEKASVRVVKKETLTAADLGKALVNFEVLNPELVICTMSGGITLEMEVTVEKGRGYVPAEQNRKIGFPSGTLFIDSIHTPIKNVKYAVENYRVEQKTDYEKLVFEVTTDGSIHPKDALTEAAKILIYHFMLFSDERIAEDIQVIEEESFDENHLHIRQLLKTKLSTMDLSVRALNCLKLAEVETLGELVHFQKSDLLKFRNFGRKSLTELEELVHAKGLHFGMDVGKYMLDKD